MTYRNAKEGYGASERGWPRFGEGGREEATMRTKKRIEKI